MNPTLQRILEEIVSIEPFPKVAIRVLEMSLAGDPDPLELAPVIQLDAGITAKVLWLANSVAKGTVVEVESIEQAAVKLGATELVRLAMSSAGHSFYAGMGSSTPRSNQSLWVESATNAIAAKLVAEERGDVPPDVAFTVGLLMNMGHVVMDRFLALERDEILGRIDLGAKMLRAEQEVLGMTHAELGGRMARRWGFPESLSDAITHHHSPQRGKDPTLCAYVNLAEALTWDALSGEGTSALAYGLSTGTLEHTGIVPKELVELRRALPVAVESQRQLFALD